MLVRRFGGRALGALANARVQIASRFGFASRGIVVKPAPFDYQAPSTLREAVDLLASNSEALVIAGGQSLMPVLAFRLATPRLLVDLRRLPGLGNIASGDDGVRLGALVRWRDIEDDERLVTGHPLLRARHHACRTLPDP
jgi:CO/xanthine dehydrogenase FAD-binding subunit